MSRLRRWKPKHQAINGQTPRALHESAIGLATAEATPLQASFLDPNRIPPTSISYSPPSSRPTNDPFPADQGSRIPGRGPLPTVPSHGTEQRISRSLHSGAAPHQASFYGRNSPRRRVNRQAPLRDDPPPQTRPLGVLPAPSPEHRRPRPTQNRTSLP